jgi:hypothetical protein
MAAQDTNACGAFAAAATVMTGAGGAVGATLGIVTGSATDFADSSGDPDVSRLVTDSECAPVARPVRCFVGAAGFPVRVEMFVTPS